MVFVTSLVDQFICESINFLNVFLLLNELEVLYYKQRQLWQHGTGPANDNPYSTPKKDTTKLLEYTEKIT